ncbi:MAG TPA: helix-turn-helix domain-containing protein [Patescibacteria group bacterium]|nr:helix-turn-helix domain-containing protein [Patescibacteria group bacterium]
MNINARNTQIERLEELSKKQELIIDYAWMLTQPQFQKSLWNNRQPMKSLEETKESLAFSFLFANLNAKSIPLKEFMDSFEETVLRACLRLTHGNQKNAAALMNLNPTTLFEKMRKLGINGRRMKLSEKLREAKPQAME